MVCPQYRPLMGVHFVTLMVLRSYLGTDTWLGFITTNALAAALFLAIAGSLYIPRGDWSYVYQRRVS